MDGFEPKPTMIFTPAIYQLNYIPKEREIPKRLGISFVHIEY